MSANRKDTFSFGVSQRNVQAIDGVENITIDGRRADIAANQLVIRLKNEDAIARFAQRHNLDVIEQEHFNMPTEVRRLPDGTVSERPSTVQHREPCFLVGVRNLGAVQTDDLKDVASKEGFRGHWEFASASGAQLTRAAISIRRSGDSDLVDVGLNSFSYPDTTTVEGNLPGQASYKYAPNNEQFWYTGRREFGLYFGSNIIDDRSGYSNLQIFGDASGIKVAVVDTGFQGASETTGIPLPIIGPGSYYVYDQYNGDSSIIGDQGLWDNPWHGRQVLSLIKAPNNDYAGTVGTAPGCTVLLEHTGDNIAWRTSAAVDQARLWGARVINMSFAGQNWLYNPLYYSLVNANNAGVVCIASVGNSGPSYDAYPAAWGEVMGVGASDKYGGRAIWSATLSSNTNFVDIWAPGSDIAVATVPGGSGTPWDYVSANGTSLSAPIVSGAVAVCMGNGQITNYTSSSNLYSATSRLYNTAYNYAVGKVLNAMKAAGQP